MIYKIKDFLKHPYIIPIYVICVADVIFFSGFALRTALKNPDVSFKRYDQPWEEYRNKQFKLYATDQHKAQHVCQAPKYELTEEELKSMK